MKIQDLPVSHALRQLHFLNRYLFYGTAGKYCCKDNTIFFRTQSHIFIKKHFYVKSVVFIMNIHLPSVFPDNPFYIFQTNPMKCSIVLCCLKPVVFFLNFSGITIFYVHQQDTFSGSNMNFQIFFFGFFASRIALSRRFPRITQRVKSFQHDFPAHEYQYSHVQAFPSHHAGDNSTPRRVLYFRSQHIPSGSA